MPGLVTTHQPWELETGWFETQGRPWIDQAEPAELIAAWEEACAADDLLVRVDKESVEFRRAIRWAERRIGELLGDSKRGPRLEVPNSVRNFDPKQRAQFRKMARIDAADFAEHLAAAVSAGEINRAQVEKWCKRKLAHTEEAEARRSTFDGTAADAEGDRWKMLHGDFRERLLEIQPGTVDLIITDPPYPAEFLPLWTDLSAIAARILKPQGVLLAMSGKIHLPQVVTALGTHLAYGWTYVMPLEGSMTRIMARQVMQAWKPWFAFSNGPWPSGRINPHQDRLEIGERHKSRYRWEQDPVGARQMLGIFAADGGALVVDPFAGTGAFGIASLAHGCQFVGVELDCGRFEATSERLKGEK